MHETRPQREHCRHEDWRAAAVVLLAAAVLLALLTVFNETKTLGLSVNETRIAEAWRAGEDPLVHGRLWKHATLALGTVAEALAVPRGTGVAMVAMRLAQNTGIFLLLALWLRMQGLGWAHGLFAMMALAWSMTMANANAHLDVSNYGAVLLTLGAACLAGRPGTGPTVAVLALMLVMAVDRTLALPIAVAFSARLLALPGVEARLTLAVTVLATAGLVALAMVTGDPPASRPGLSYVLDALLQAFAVVSVLPFIVFMRPGAGRDATTQLARVAALAWIAVHLVQWDLREPRFWLLPLALVVLPAVLGVLAAAARQTVRETTPHG